MDDLPELNLPEGWEHRSPVFIGPAEIRQAKRERSLVPLVSKDAYEAEREGHGVRAAH